MFCSEKGFTMIELMVAVLIMTVGLLGLFQAVYTTVNFNMGNQLRSAAVTYGDEVMAKQLNQPFTSIVPAANQKVSMSRPIASGFWNFSAATTITSVSSNSTNVQVLVSWKYKGKPYTHNLSTLVSQASQ